jgi:hypothetical protein
VHLLDSKRVYLDIFSTRNEFSFSEYHGKAKDLTVTVHELNARVNSIEAGCEDNKR